MQFYQVAAALALAMTASASTVSVVNKCSSSIYLTTTDSNQSTVGPNELAAGGTYNAAIVGTGNSLGLTTNTDYYSSTTAKLILGTSTTSGTLYWSVSDVDGNPFDSTGFTIDSNNTCGSANSPDGQTHGCADNGVTLLLTACSN